jgi:hypothetical protein
VAKAALYCAHRTSTITDSPFKLACILLHRAAWSILNCARPTRAFRGRALREQEDDQAAHPILCEQEGHLAAPRSLFQHPG